MFYNRNIISIFFSLFGFSLQLFKSLYIKNKKANLYLPILHFFQKKNLLFSIFRYYFSLIKNLLFSLVNEIDKFFKIKNYLFKLLALIFSYINILILTFILHYLKNENNILFKLYDFLKIKIYNFIKFILIQIYQYKDSKNFIFWFYEIYGTRRKWVKQDSALIFISHFIIFNFTLAYLVDLFVVLLYLILQIIFFRKVVLVTKQCKAYLYTSIEIVKITIFILASFFVLQGKYPLNIPLFSKAVVISVGPSPDEKNKELELPESSSLKITELLDKNIRI